MQFKSYVMAKSMVASCGLAIVLSGCSSSGSDKVNLNSLASIPSTSQLVGGSSSSSTSLSRYALTLGATGTPPLMSSLASGTSADQYFWNGLVQDIIDSEVVIDDSIRSQFYGMTADSAGGMGACQMVQSVGQAMERITENAATICYMKKIPTVAEIVPQNGNAETTSDEVFSQQSEDRWVKVLVRNMGGDPSNSQDVFIRVVGSDSLTGDKYQVRLHFCAGGEVTGSETITVDRETGLFTTSSSFSEDGSQRGTGSVQAYLKEVDGTFVLDPDNQREGTSTYTNGSNEFAGKILVEADGTVNAWSWNKGSGWDDRSFVKAITTGDSYSTLRFLDGSYRGKSSGTGWEHSYSGATTFDTSYYKAIASGELYDYIQTYSLTTDTFFSGGFPDVTVSLDDYSCDQEVDYEISMDFDENSALEAIREDCEGERNDYQMCWSGDVNTAQGMLWDD